MMTRTCFVFLLMLIVPFGYIYGCPDGDLTGDCKVDFDDIMLFAGEWLAGPGSIANIVGAAMRLSVNG